MKKIFNSKIVKIIFIVLIIFVVLYSISFFVLKKFLTEDKIKNLISQNLSKAGFLVKIENLSYNFGIFNTSVSLNDFWLENEIFYLKSKNVRLSFNPYKVIFKKEIDLKRVDLSDFEIFIKKERKDTLKEKNEKVDEKKGGIEIFSNIYFKNGSIVYDTFNIKNLKGFLKFSYNEKIDFETNLNFDFSFKGNYLKNNSIIAKGNLDSNLNIQKINVKNELLEVDGNLEKKEEDLKYSFSFKTISLENIVNLFYKNEKFKIHGNTSGILRGELSIKDDFKKQIDSIIQEMELQFSSFALSYEKDTIYVFENSILNKQRDKLVFFGNILFNKDTLDAQITLSPQMFLNDTIDLVLNLDGMDLKISERFLKDKKIKISGKSKISFKTLCDKKFITDIDSLVSKSYITFNSSTVRFFYDTLNLILKQAEVNLDKGILKGFSKVEEDGSFGTLSISGDYLKKIFEISTLSTFPVQKFLKGYQGNGELNGKITLNLKDKKNYGLLSIRLKNLKVPNLSDIFTLNVQDVKFKNFAENVELKNILLDGKNLSGVVKSLNFSYGKNLISFSGEIYAEYLNYDSLFVQQKKVDQKEKTKPPKIDEKLKGNLKVTVKRLFFKDELLENIVMIIKVENGVLTVDPLNSNFLKGNLAGKFVYNSKNSGYINSNFEGKNVFLDDFMKRKKYLPFDIGAKVDLKSDLNFFQDKVKESINGKIDVKAKNGWIHFTGLVEKISSVLKLPLADTFYFDDMYGEFEIDSQKVKFEDFEMEKNGHNLLYSGVVDFNKSMNVKGRYTIDMRVADTGLLEKILKMTNYPSDTIYVDFEITGNYSKPNINIKYNSVGEYLKDKTNESVNQMIDDLKNMFKR
uniref:Uncharacterized protein n=1 Tax=candidate division WOR-3 bacterium TaxID=2052148 RepID=A0A7C3NGU4_UNCW3